jgi:Ca2+-binding RTX toxin-like protein
MSRTNRLGSTFQALEAREVPAFVTGYAAGNLWIAFNNNAMTAQSVVISAANGRVTLNDRLTGIPAADIRSITVVGSARDNIIDLRSVGPGSGFRGLDGRISLLGMGGADVLIGSQFGDQISGGAGCDQLFGEAGNDTMTGGRGADWLCPGAGDDIIIGRQWVDWIDLLEPGDRVV